MPYASRICYIFPLWMESKALVKSTKINVAFRFFARTPSRILRMVNICEVVDLFLRKPFWFFLSMLSMKSMKIMIYIYIYIYICVCVCVCVYIYIEFIYFVTTYVLYMWMFSTLSFRQSTYVLYMCMFPACCFRQRTYVAICLVNGVLNETWAHSCFKLEWFSVGSGRYYMEVILPFSKNVFTLVCFSPLWYFIYLSLCENMSGIRSN